MKKIILLTFCFLAISFVTFAGKFVLIPVNEANNLESLFNNEDLKIHYYCDDFVLATTEVVSVEGTAILDEKAFADVSSYAIVYCFNDQKEDYLSKLSKKDEVLYSGEHFLIMKILSENFMPAKNDGMLVVMNSEAILSTLTFDFPVITEIDPFIQLLNETVSTDSLLAYVQHLQDYGTRAYWKPQAYEAQDWMQSKFEAWGLEVEIQTFSAAGNGWGTPAASSGNVIAVQTGTVHPNEFIVCGAHYDSFVPYNYDNCPGADDNATGTATVLELARILSQYETERSIIYCCFSAEEVGLFGSKAYAERCQQQGMNIVGYFNIDMSGYLKPGTEIHIDLIHPSTANPLANFLKNINDVYFQIPLVSRPNLSGGDSDHTSFNQKGFMGIWTFEDWNNCSPQIHTVNDIIGPSVNKPEQVNIFTQVNLASIATLAAPMPSLAPPTNCVATFFEDKHVEISWDAPTANIPDIYYVYRDDIKISETVESYCLDMVEDYEAYCYTVTAVYDDIQSGFSNESCGAVPPLAPPTNCAAANFFEMQIKIIWDAPEEATPDGYFVYRDNVKIFEEPITATEFFDTPDEAGKYCYNVTAVYGETESEFSNQSCAEAFNNITEYSAKFKIYPNPARDELRIKNYELREGEIEIFDVTGRKQKSEIVNRKSEIVINISHLPAGVYFVRIEKEVVGKFVKE